MWVSAFATEASKNDNSLRNAVYYNFDLELGFLLNL